MSSSQDQCLLLVHAHPDDETIGNGATMAKYVAMGRRVTLVTCTAGEEGEVLVPELAHLAADRDDSLGAHRVDELAAAMKVLGVTDHRFLGGAHRFRDSGMQWDPAGHAVAADETRDDTFWAADLLEAATELVAVIREVQPQVMVTYDQFGGYGHPDHIQAHRVAMYASQLAAVTTFRPDLGDVWDVEKIYWTALSLSRMRASIAKLADLGIENPFEGFDFENPPPFMTNDEFITTCVDARDFAEQKMDAMRAHATQITVDGPFFALSNNLGNAVWGEEFYRLVKGELDAAAPKDADGWETDLFAGIADG